MDASAEGRARQFYAQTYDAAVSDWPGEIDFYRSLAKESSTKGRPVLEIACGTGRVAIRLAQSDIQVVGLDVSPAMLDVARANSRETTNIQWVEMDMRNFELGESFGLILIPGHAFQNLNEQGDQVACLESIGRHLHPEGKLVIHLDHQSVAWLGDLVRDKGGVFEQAEQFVHPETGRSIYTSRAWSYEPSTQTAIAQTVWQERDEDGNVVEQWESGPIRLHCIFRFEMEHLLVRAGFKVSALYGSFLREPLTDSSEEMIWVATKSVSC
jgi:ubiquinone/menaquinone biosynthesis C-methylase UbiE